MSDLASTDNRKSIVRTGIIAALIALGALGLGFAAVPLYRIFCQVTGYGGTIQRADAEAARAVTAASGQISIRFDSNVRDLPWTFAPEHVTDSVPIGGRDMAIYIAENQSDRETMGTAAYNVTPEQAGKYFNKIQCFCFTQQTLKAGQRMRMPVLYYIDPAILDDPDTRDIKEITLSYTFFPVDQPGEDG